MHNLVPQFILEKLQQQQFHGAFSSVALFIDGSGFTNLTETLMEYGKVGAEALANTLLTILTPLVDIVYSHNGFIAFFAGDAFVALFPGDIEYSYPHALLAARQIHDQMAANPVYRTPYGDFTFAIKATLAEGQVSWGIWSGDLDSHETSQRCASYFAGEAIDRCIEAEQYATGGDILMTQAVNEALKQIKPDLVRVEPAVSDPDESIFRIIGVDRPRLMAASAQISPPQAVTPSLEQQALATHFFPSELLQLPAQGEFRQVVTLFINVQWMPANDSPFTKKVFQLLSQYGGFLGRLGRIGAQDAGGTLLLFWGAPTSYENDVERALNFILDLKKSVSIPLRAGITNHLVYAGFIGSSLREEYTCHGIGVNLAARQMIAAPWGNIWLDEETYEQAEDQFELKLVGQLRYKGFAEERSVYALVGHIQTKSSSFRQGRLIGRDGELEQLRKGVEPVFEGRFAGFVAVTGEAGIGKSRLLYEFKLQLQRSREHEVLWCYCPADEILRQSLNPFRYFLRGYFDQTVAQSTSINRVRFEQRLDELIAQTPDSTIQRELDRTRSFLGALMGLTWAGSLYEQLEPPLRFENSLSALKHLLMAESLRQPVIINLEDVHWLDKDSWQFIQRLCRNISPYPIAIILSSRVAIEPGFIDQEVPLQTLNLQPFATNDIHHFVEAWLSHDIAATVVSILAERTQGNPFFIEQMLLYLQQQPMIDQALYNNPADIKELIPSNIRSLLISRLDRLAPEVKQVVQTAAVLGQEFELPVLAQMLPIGSKVTAVAKRAETEAIWTTVGRHRRLFKHVLLRDAAYDMQLPARLRVLHQRAAEVIRQIYRVNLEPHSIDLAHHYERANLVPEAARWYKRAAEYAVEQHANDDAIAYFSRALALTPETDLVKRYNLLLARETLYDTLGMRIAQSRDLEILETLANRLDNNQQRVEVTIRRAGYAQAIGDFALAITLAQTVVNLSQSEKEISLKTRGYLIWGQSLRRIGDFKQARRMLEQAQALAQAGQLLQLEAACLRAISMIALNQGNYDAESQRYMQLALSIFRRNNDKRAETTALQNLSIDLIFRGDYAKAITYLQRALSICRPIGGRREEGWVLNNLGILFDYQGDYARAQDFLEKALWIFQEIIERRGEGLVLSNLGLLFHHLGDDQATKEFCQRALSILQEIGGEPHFRGYALTFLGHAQMNQGHLAEAADSYRQALTLRRDLNQHHMALDSLAGLARVSLAQGELINARFQVEGILSHLEDHPGLEGADEPLRIYLTCYQVLSANRDQRAQTILKAAYNLLQERGAKLSDEARHSYFRNVPAHQEILKQCTNNM